MMYEYFTNAAVYLIVGCALLLVWRRHRGQAFARDLGCSTITAALVPLGFLLHQNVPAQYQPIGTAIVVCGAIPNLLFLTSAVLRLAERSLRPGVAVIMAACMVLILTVPSTEQRLWMWPCVNLLFFVTLGVLSARWLWNVSVIERLMGPLLVLLGVNQLPLILYGEAGLELNLFGATMVRTAIACGFLFAALERAAKDISKLYEQRDAASRQLLHKATHDELTGLPNRTILMERLNEYCEHGHCSLVILNIDRFKLFNQSQGHITGDHVLKAFAAKLQQALGPRGQLMRLGSDEFAIVDPDEEATRELSWRLHSVCRQALVVPAGEYFIDASMGMAICPEHGNEGEALLRAAMSAMHQAKRMPGTSLAMAEARFEQISAQALEQEQALRKGIRNHELYLEYQPKVDGTGQLRGLEALARWQRPGMGKVSPAEFIGIAERTGLIAELGAVLLQEACRQIAEWLREAGDCVPVAVNVSPVQLLNPGFILLVEDALQRHRVPARYLTLEITESAAVDNLENTRIQLSQLRELGVNVAMDDFGTGFSSLSMLRELPLNVVKIDRGLIAPLAEPDAVAVVTAICRLAEALQLQVVAEGIETVVQAQAALSAGCHELQGYYYARPMLPDDALLWLRRTFDVTAPQASSAP